MKNQSGKSPLEWIITIAVVLLIAGVAVAMIFAENEDVSNIIEQYKNKDTNTVTNTQTETNTDEDIDITTDTNNTVETELE